jgi:hypothetical protein
LLIFEIFVGRDQHLEFAFGFPKEIAIGQFRPSHLKRGDDNVTGQGVTQWRGRALIEQYFHDL